MASKKSNEDAFNRMNFLYQAASVCLKMSTERSVHMAAYYGMLLRSVGKKAQARMDLSMKRTLCKGCHIVLVPGITALVRLQKRPAACVTWLCKCCSTIKRFNLRKDYKIWVERDEAVVGNNNNINNNNNNTANVRTDRNAAETSTTNKAANFKSDKVKQNITACGITLNKADCVSSSVVPADKSDGNVSVDKLCDAFSSDKINPSNFSFAHSGFKSAVSCVNITTSDVDPSHKIHLFGSDSKQRDVDPADNLKIIVSDTRLCETDPSDNVNLLAVDINGYHIDTSDKVSDMKLCGKISRSNEQSNIEVIDKLDIKVHAVESSVEVTIHDSDVKQSSINLANKLKESASHTKLCDAEPSDNVNENFSGNAVCKNNKTDVMDVDETVMDKVMVVDNNNTVEDKDRT